MPAFDVLALRPCGICAAYVPVDKGCQHWRPQVARTLKSNAAGDDASRARAAEKRRNQRAAVAAREAVAALRAAMTR